MASLLKSLVKRAVPKGVRRYVPHLRSRGNLMRFLGILGGRRALCGPENAVIETTHHCNAACAMCMSHGYLFSESYGKRREHRDGRTVMEKEVFERLVDDLASIRTRMVTLSGKGEPFMHRHALDFIRYIKSKGLKLMIYSNGILIDEKRAEVLVETGCDILNVSVNAGTPDTYRSINPKGRFEEVELALQRIGQIKKIRNSDLPSLQVSFVIFKQNHLEIERMLELGASWGASEILFYPAGIYSETSELALSEEEMRTVVEHSRKISSNSGSYPNHNLPELAKAFEELIQSGREFVSGQRGLPCYTGWLFVNISPDGCVVPCCYCTKSLGNLIDRSFAEIWNGPDYQDFRSKCLEMEKNPTMFPGCECFTNCNFFGTNRDFYQLAHPFTPLPANSIRQ